MSRTGAVGLGLLAGLALCFWLWPLTTGFASGADQTGYLGLARNFSEGRLREPLRAPTGPSSSYFSPWAFVPLGFTPVEAGRMASVYPPGLPAFQFLAFTALRDWDLAARSVTFVHGLLAVFLLYRLGRLWGLPRTGATLTYALFVLNPIVLRHFLLNMSDGPATTWNLAAVYFASKSEKKRGYLLPAGLAWAVASAVRPTNLLLAPALLWCVGPRPRRWAGLAVFSAVFALPLAWYNAVQFGSPLAFGYGQAWFRFSSRYLLPTLWQFARWLFRFCGPGFAVLTGLALLRRDDCNSLRKFAVAGFLWFSVFCVFYGLYWFSRGPWVTLRFLLPAFPGLYLTAGLGLKHLIAASRARPWVRVAAAACVVWCLVSSGYWVKRLSVVEVRREEARYLLAAQSTQSLAAGDVVVLAGDLSGPVYFYTNFPLIRWDRLGARDLERLLAGLPAATSVVAVLWPAEANVVGRVFPGLLAETVRSGPFVLAWVNRSWQSPGKGSR